MLQLRVPIIIIRLAAVSLNVSTHIPTARPRRRQRLVPRLQHRRACRPVAVPGNFRPSKTTTGTTAMTFSAYRSWRPHEAFAEPCRRTGQNKTRRARLSPRARAERGDPWCHCCSTRRCGPQQARPTVPSCALRRRSLMPAASRSGIILNSVGTTTARRRDEYVLARASSLRVTNAHHRHGNKAALRASPCSVPVRRGHRASESGRGGRGSS